MSRLFKLNNERLFEEIKSDEFKDEKKELRDLFAKNMQNGFFSNLTFLKEEYYILNVNEPSFSVKKKGKISKPKNFVDTICYYDKEKTFVLFEYKNNATEDKKAIEQIFDYRQLLKSNKGDCQHKLIKKFYSKDPSKAKISEWDNDFYN